MRCRWRCPASSAQALRWLLKADAPLRLKPRLDPALLRWLFGFARHCNWEQARHATLAKAPLLLRSRELIEDLVRRQGLDCEFAAQGTLNVFRDAAHFGQAQETLPSRSLRPACTSRCGTRRPSSPASRR